MATIELDPLFLKALVLLRSKSRESADQLKALLDDVLGKTTKSDSDRDRKDERPKVLEDKSKLSSSKRPPEDIKKGVAKRPLEKPKQESNLTPTPPKKLKLEIPKRTSTVRRAVIEDDSDSDIDTPTEDMDEDDVIFMKEGKSEIIEDLSSDSDELPSVELNKKSSDVVLESTAADDFALELGLACIICKRMEVVARNQLIECQECHNLYHQLCHKPNVVDADPNDPRLVWYCARCQKNMKKAADKKASKSSTPSSSSPSDPSPLFEKEGGSSAAHFFKRSEPKTSPASSVGKSQPFTGLANLAANLSGKSTSSAKSGITSSKLGQSTIIGSAAKNLKASLSGSSSSKHSSKAPPLTPTSTSAPKHPSSSTSGSGSIKAPSTNPKVSSSGMVKPVGHKSSLSSTSTKMPSSSAKPTSLSSSSSKVNPVNVAKHKLMSTSGSGSRSPSPQPVSGQGKNKGTGVKNMPQASQATAMKRLQQMKRKASKR